MKEPGKASHVASQVTATVPTCYPPQQTPDSQQAGSRTEKTLHCNSTLVFRSYPTQMLLILPIQGGKTMLLPRMGRLRWRLARTRFREQGLQGQCSLLRKRVSNSPPSPSFHLFPGDLPCARSYIPSSKNWPKSKEHTKLNRSSAGETPNLHESAAPQPLSHDLRKKK